MRLLLDTHVFLWYISADARLPAVFRAAVQEASNEVFLSVASVWESVIKNALGNLPLPEPPEVYLPRARERHGIAALDLNEKAMVHLAGLPAVHRDPFDRVIVAQALQHDLILLSVDPSMARYPAKRLPA
jgi:PIN domain nuclease of toxin-antitoxin system